MFSFMNVYFLRNRFFTVYATSRLFRIASEETQNFGKKEVVIFFYLARLQMFSVFRKYRNTNLPFKFKILEGLKKQCEGTSKVISLDIQCCFQNEKLYSD